VEKDEGGGAATEEGRRTFFQKKSFYHTYDIISGEKWVLGFYPRFATFFFLSTILQSLPVSCFLKRD